MTARFLTSSRCVKFTYNTKKGADGELQRYKTRFAIRGDHMVVGRDFDHLHTSGHTPYHSARRLLLATTAAAGRALESWDVPRAYPRATANPRYRQTMRQPRRSDGTLTVPERICVIQQLAVLKACKALLTRRSSENNMATRGSSRGGENPCPSSQPPSPRRSRTLHRTHSRGH